MPRQRHPPANARGGRRFGLPASTPVQARRRSLPRPVPAPPPPAVTHAPGNEVPARPAAASRCSLRSRLSLSASVSPQRLRRERGSSSVLPICRRQPPRLRSLPVADHASAADNRRPRHKKAAAVSLLRFIILRCAWMRICFGRCRRCAGHRPSIHRHGRCRPTIDRHRHHHRRPTR